MDQEPSTLFTLFARPLRWQTHRRRSLICKNSGCATRPIEPCRTRVLSCPPSWPLEQKCTFLRGLLIKTDSLAGTPVEVPSPQGELLHLQFRRFAGCPICNLHLRSPATHIDEVRAQGVHEVVVFHSSAETMRPFQGDLPFDVVADPDRYLYSAYGVETSLRSVADPRAWTSAIKGVFAAHPASLTKGEGGHLGLPADFLIRADGRIAAAHYGRQANDQWLLPQIFDLVQKARASE